MSTPALARSPAGRARPAGRAGSWALVPLLALCAYAPVLGIGFLSDDWVLLDTARSSGVDLGVFVPYAHGFLYRPVGGLLTWQVGWWLWGLHPLPYHLLGLLLHAATALALALWLAAATGRPALGRLAGALFAVFPLHLEAVGWLAAQWDAWAVCFALTSLWLFTRWWQTSGQRSAVSSQRPAHEAAPSVGQSSALDSEPSAPSVGQSSALDRDEIATRNTQHATRNTQHATLAAAVACYALGLFSKESLFTWLPVYAGAAWLATPLLSGAQARRLLAALLPFAAVLAANAALRVAAWGTLGGYPGPSPGLDRLLSDGLLPDLRLLLAPLNAAIWGPAVAAGVAVAAGLGWAFGLLRVGRATGRVLGLAGVWVALALLPVLSLPPSLADLQQNRYLYLAAAGYCVGAAALLDAARRAAGKPPAVGQSSALDNRPPTTRNTQHATRNPQWLVAVLLAACIGVTWTQLGPWQTATAQTQAILAEVDRLVPAQPGGMAWYLQDPPDSYKGAYVFRLGLNVARQFATGELPWIRHAAGVDAAPLDRNTGAAFAIRFGYDAATARYHVAAAAGLTDAAPPPGGSAATLWDFRACAPDAVGQWAGPGGRLACVPGPGLAVGPGAGAPQLVHSAIPVPAPTGGARFIRLRVAARYPPAPAGTAAPAATWFWQAAGAPWRPVPSHLPLKQDGLLHVYWAFLPAALLTQPAFDLRLAPTDGPGAATVAWIALDPAP